MFPRFARSWNFESCAVWRQLDPDQESLCYNRKESSAHCFNLVYLKQVKSYLEPIRVGNMRLNWIFAQLTFICTFRLFEWHDLIKSDFIEFKLCWADWIWITSALLSSPPPTLTPTTHSPSTWIPPPPLLQPFLLRCRMTSMTRRFLNQPSASDVNRWPKTFKTLAICPMPILGLAKSERRSEVMTCMIQFSIALKTRVNPYLPPWSSHGQTDHHHHVNLSFHSNMYYHIIISLSHCPMSLSTSQELAWEDRSRGLRQNWPVGNS